MLKNSKQQNLVEEPVIILLQLSDEIWVYAQTQIDPSSLLYDKVKYIMP